MNKSEVARVLKEMANLLELVEANCFKHSAFRNTAIAVEDWRDNLNQTVSERNVIGLTIIGKRAGKFINELIRKGNF